MIFHYSAQPRRGSSFKYVICREEKKPMPLLRGFFSLSTAIIRIMTNYCFSDQIAMENSSSPDPPIRHSFAASFVPSYKTGERKSATKKRYTWEWDTRCPGSEKRIAVMSILSTCCENMSIRAEKIDL